MVPLKDAVILITGSSRGLGAHIVQALAPTGARLALTARTPEAIAPVAQAAAAAGARVAAIPADLTQPEDRLRLVAEAEAALGPIDILINNAGVMNNGAFIGQTPESLDAMVTTNVTAPLHLTRAVLPGMVQRRRGHILTLASIAGKTGLGYSAVYGGTKAALLAWMAGLRVELEGTGVSATVISPGYVNEVGVFARLNARPHPMLGEVTPAEVAGAVGRALREAPAEIMVQPWWSLPALAPVLMLYPLAPALVHGMVKLFHVDRFWKRIYDSHTR